MTYHDDLPLWTWQKHVQKRDTLPSGVSRRSGWLCGSFSVFIDCVSVPSSSWEGSLISLNLIILTIPLFIWKFCHWPYKLVYMDYCHRAWNGDLHTPATWVLGIQEYTTDWLRLLCFHSLYSFKKDLLYWSLWIYVHPVHAGAWGGQKRALYPLEL